MISGNGQTDRRASSVKPILVLEKARRILDCFSPDAPELTFPRITAASGLPASTCYRLLHNLTAEGFLEREGDLYRPGMKLLRWSALVVPAHALLRKTQPVLDQLRDETGESAFLYVREGMARRCVAVAEARQSVVRVLHVGQVMPLHAGSGGKVLLAHDEALTQHVLGEGLTAHTPSTFTDGDQLMRELVEIRRRGYSVSFEERDLGASSISAPVWDVSGHVVAALGIGAPVQRVSPDTYAPLLPHVLRAAQVLSRRLGHEHDEENV